MTVFYVKMFPQMVKFQMVAFIFAAGKCVFLKQVDCKIESRYSQDIHIFLVTTRQGIKNKKRIICIYFRA